MMHLYLLVLIISGLLHSSGNTPPQKDQLTVYVVQEAWHTGIVLQTSDVSATVFDEIKNYSTDTYLDVSWGDEKYYQLPNPGISIGASAILWPTPSVIRLQAFSQEVKSYYEHSTIMKISMSREKFNELCSFISESFERNEAGKIQPSTVYRKSRTFFLSKRKYSLFRTCNTWVALAFKKSGFDVHTFCLVTAGQLFRRLDNVRGSEFLQKE